MDYPKPVGNRVVAEVIETEEIEEKKGSLYIPTTIQEEFVKGKVISVGIGKAPAKMTVKKNDIILFAKKVGTPFTHNGKTYLVMAEDSILVVLSEENK
jgi:chaperonin GroES